MDIFAWLRLGMGGHGRRDDGPRVWLVREVLGRGNLPTVVGALPLTGVLILYIICYSVILGHFTGEFLSL